jgi:hypothetical protein
MLEFIFQTQYKHVKLIIKMQNLVPSKSYKQKRSKWCKAIDKNQNRGTIFQFLYVKKQNKIKNFILSKNFQMTAPC